MKYTQLSENLAALIINRDSEAVLIQSKDKLSLEETEGFRDFFKRVGIRGAVFLGDISITVVKAEPQE